MSSQEQAASLKQRGRLPTLKDLNWKAACPLGRPLIPGQTGLMLNASDRDQLLSQLETDAKFLSHRGLMDYSLLVGIASFEERCLVEPQSGGPRRCVLPELCS